MSSPFFMGEWCVHIQFINLRYHANINGSRRN